MVILDGSFRSSMLTNGSHQYIQPDPFPPISSAMDAKTSPLAMLQKTCSQIGADTSSSKPLITAEKKKEEKKESPAAAVEKPTFKPYELDKKDDHSSPRASGESPKERKSPGKATGGGSTADRKTPKSETTTSSSSGTSPITRPGAEVLAGVGSGKDLPSLGLHKPGSLPLPLPAYLPGADVATAAALRPTLPGLPGLYPPSSLAASYLGLSAHHRPGEKCQSPYCACIYSTPHGYGAPCPAGCVQCEHAKSLGALPSPYLSLANPFYPATSLASLGLPSAAGQPIICNWMVEGRYCGKRFSSTDELMQHLRTHTNLSASDSALSLLHPAYQASLLSSHRSPFVPPSALSPLSAARFHPYSKPTSAHPSLSLPGAPHPASLAAYYSPYSALYPRPPLP